MLEIPTDLVPEMEKELRRGWHRNAVTAEIQAKQLGAIHQHQMRSIEGIGQLRMSVPADAYHYWGQRLGYDCWSDKQFLSEFERDNPTVKANGIGMKMQFGYTPGEKRFSKSYGTL